MTATKTSELRAKAERLKNCLRKFGQVGIAFSGGVDSSFLLRSAIDALGAENVLALHAHSCLQKQEEQERAASWLVRFVDIEPLTWPEFIRNPPDRCYLCKLRIYRMFQNILAREGFAVLFDGTNCDDLQQGENGRPGLRAIAELGVQTPLADCGLNKAEIRELSRDLGLATWNQPSDSCLATRIPAGMRITAERLAHVTAMEQVLYDAGFFNCRARLLDDTVVCLQLRQKDIDRFCTLAVLQEVSCLLKRTGAGKIVLDLDGR
ncbi:ATP-dependent sacrificial sulfur transferase LarE [Desulfobulbus sp. F1]|nr:ATP-dependent sacrificial sulfur transferase LarE [Desulfobulbus sp. F1]